ncbi:homeotic protein female sterile-like [Planococcus citri]|uniref:homeotic protein female sterile-like n=1 Tax=Planococcus citri TaxID=170843 RepID=UPI0031FA0A6C
MELENIKFAVTLILGLIGVVYGKAIADPNYNGLSASQQTLFRRNPNLFLNSFGYGGGSGGQPGGGGGMSSTSLQFSDPNSTNGQQLNVQSQAAGVGDGNNGGGTATTGLQFSNGNNYPNSGNQGLSVQSTASGAGGGDGNGNGGGGMSSTSLNFNNGGTCDGSNPNNSGLSVQSTAVGAGGGDGNGNGGGGMSATGLQFNSGNNPDGTHGLNVQSTAVGAGGGDGNGNGGGGMSSTSLQFNNGDNCDGSNPSNTGLSVQSTAVGAGSGNDSLGASQTNLQTTNNGPVNPGPVTDKPEDQKDYIVPDVDHNNTVGASPTAVDSKDNDSNLQVDNAAIGATNGDQSVALADTHVHESDKDKTVDVNNTAVGAGDNAAALTNTSVQEKDGDGHETKVDTTSVGQASGDDAIAGSKTTVQVDNKDTPAGAPVPIAPTPAGAPVPIAPTQHDDTVQVQNSGVGVADQNGVVGVSTNSVHIDDDKEGDIDLTTLAGGSATDHGAEGVSGVGVQMADGTDKTSNDGLKVTATNTAVGDSTQGVGGSVSTVHVDDKKNERSLEAQTVGLGYKDDTTEGTLTADSMKYHDVDQEHHQEINPDNGSFFQSSKHEENDVQSQNLSSQFKTVDDNGSSTTTTHTTQTKQTQVTQQQSYYTQQQIINQPVQGDVVLGQPNQVVDQDQNLLVSHQSQGVVQNQQVDQDQNLLVAHQSQDVVQNQQVDQDQNLLVAHQSQDVVQNQQVDQDQNLLVAHQSQGVVQNQQVDQDQNLLVAHQSQGVVQNQQVDQDQNLLVSHQSQNIVQNQQINQSESHVVSQQSQNVIQNQQVDQDQNLLVSHQSQNVDSTVQHQSQMTSTQQQSQTVDQTQSYSLGSHQPISPKRHQASPLLCPDNNQGPGVVCHYEVASIFEYDNDYVLRPSQIVTEYCDVLIVSYAVLDVNRFQIGAFSPDEERIFSEIASLKNDRLKIILQLQYVAFYEQYITILNCEDNLNKFTSSVINYLQKWNFDGIELPIMVPQSNDKFYETSPIVKEKFPILVQQLRSNLRDDQVISVCLPIEPDYIDFAYDIPKLLKYVDWFSIITLDYNVPEQGILQHTSPLTQQTSSDPYCIDFTVNYLLTDLNVPSDKLIINLPLYGSSFVLEDYKNPRYGARVSGKGPKGPSSNVDGFLTISELCSLPRLNWLNSPALVTDYDDVPTLILKVTYARSKCLGGVGIHSISMDDPQGQLCGRGCMPFTRVISLTYDPSRDTFGKDDNLEVINYIDKHATNKYDV